MEYGVRSIYNLAHSRMELRSAHSHATATVTGAHHYCGRSMLPPGGCIVLSGKIVLGAEGKIEMDSI